MTKEFEQFISVSPLLLELSSKFTLSDSWYRPPGYQTLVQIILEQLVSLRSGEVTFQKLIKSVGTITPEIIYKTNGSQLNQCGITRQKITAMKSAAEMILKKEIDLSVLGKIELEESLNILKKIKGVGDWTAQIYLMMAHKNLDIWPIGDRALVVAVQNSLGIKFTPDKNTMIKFGQDFKPYRSYATRLLWLDYLDKKK